MIRIYCCPRAWKYFSQLRIKASGQHISPTPSKERDNQQTHSGGSISSTQSEHYQQSSTSNLSNPPSKQPSNDSLKRADQHQHSDAKRSPSFLITEDNSISEDPLLLFSIYQGHTADILDVAWSRNHFLLSSSMDKTVRLWHVTRVECLCTFFHADFVSTAQFHPHDDRYFVSGSLDGKLRLWNIPDKKVTMWNEVMSLPAKDSEQPSHGLITASDRKSTRLNSSHSGESRMPSSA